MLAALVVEAWAFIDAIRRPAGGLHRRGQADQAAVAAHSRAWRPSSAWPASRTACRSSSILPIVAFVAAAIYMVDVRPKVREFKGGGTSSGALRPLVRGPLSHPGRPAGSGQ